MMQSDVASRLSQQSQSQQQPQQQQQTPPPSAPQIQPQQQQQQQQPTGARPSTAAAAVRMPMITRAPMPGSLVGVRHMAPTTPHAGPTAATMMASHRPSAQPNVPPPPYPGLRPNIHAVNNNRLPVIPGGATVTAVPATVAGNISFLFDFNSISIEMYIDSFCFLVVCAQHPYLQRL